MSVLLKIAGEDQNGYDAAVEAEEGRESLRKRIEAELSGELKAVFGCLWEGERRTRENARRLGMTEKAVVQARRRLVTRMKRLQGTGLLEEGAVG